ncbi:hypothetical protein [Edaphobacter modestus]|uniref:Uncharacterized protein n=1 Tax=Edaphobacter modestus TaxID=388466 RepID=A0A4Q7Y0Z5_9BACT|nr:hypothetical protein [Edaphobacter modestus]RZU29691.1 hypothetical protein BDD14_6295 [Edaphobacter modestus]
MRIGRTAVRVVLLFSMVGAAKERHYPLPSSAVITIGQLHIDPKTDSTDIDSCKFYHLTESDIRKQFRTYHQIDQKELHDRYSYVYCWIEGTVQVKGKTYIWESHLDNVLITTYPDGVKKMLGGEPSGELSQ